MKEKLTARQVQAIKTQNKIYRVALDLVEKNGFDNITVEDISKKAGVSVGAFYHYFNSKNDILFEIFHRFDNYFKNEVHFTDENISEQILLFFAHYTKYTEITGIDTAKKLYGAMDKLFLEKNRYMRNLLNEIIKKGQESGNITTDMSSEQIATSLLVIVRGIVYDWCLHDGNYDLEEATITFFKRLIPMFESK